MIAFMQEALQLAERGRGRTSPNPTVGALIERNGEILGRGFPTWAARDPAEIVALREAGAAARATPILKSMALDFANYRMPVLR